MNRLRTHGGCRFDEGDSGRKLSPNKHVAFTFNNAAYANAIRPESGPLAPETFTASPCELGDAHSSTVTLVQKHQLLKESISRTVSAIQDSKRIGSTMSRHNPQFSTRHALPLTFVRILCPRLDPREHAKRTCDANRSQPQTRQIRGLKQCLISTQTRNGHVRTLSIRAASSRSRAVRDFGRATTLPHQSRALATGGTNPRRVLNLRQSASGISPQTGFVLGSSLIFTCPRGRRTLSSRSYCNIHAGIRSDPPYVRL